MTVEEHTESKTITETWIDPTHPQRDEESPTFRKNRDQLIKEGHGCFICGSKENLQAHDYGCEWSLWDEVDPVKLKRFLEIFDAYGYGFAMKLVPITTADDIRNLLLLCEKHHIKDDTGIHDMTFPIWIMQRLKKAP